MINFDDITHFQKENELADFSSTRSQFGHSKYGMFLVARTGFWRHWQEVKD